MRTLADEPQTMEHGERGVCGWDDYKSTMIARGRMNAFVVCGCGVLMRQSWDEDDYYWRSENNH